MNTFGVLERLQTLLHELLFSKADPPLARLPVLGVEDFFANSIAGLLTQLLQVLTHNICKEAN
jgi:hypothetical protein